MVLEIELQLEKTDDSIPLRHLGGKRVPLAEARASVLETRRAKGMVLDAAQSALHRVGDYCIPFGAGLDAQPEVCLLYTSPSPRD